MYVAFDFVFHAVHVLTSRFQGLDPGLWQRNEGLFPWNTCQLARYEQLLWFRMEFLLTFLQNKIWSTQSMCRLFLHGMAPELHDTRALWTCFRRRKGRPYVSWWIFSQSPKWSYTQMLLRWDNVLLCNFFVFVLKSSHFSTLFDFFVYVCVLRRITIFAGLTPSSIT